MTKQYGRYRVHGRLGTGGMADVHRATLTGPGGFEKEVALKVVPERVVSSEGNIKALVNEARIGGQMRHPNIVEVYELGQDGDHHYVAMELVRGKTLSDLLERCRETGARLPRAVVLEIAMQVTSGLHYAHGFRTSKGQRASLVHRDLKPQNLMLDERGTVKIMDFGIARSSLNLYLTTTGSLVKGTPLYIAPEQLEDGDISPATDLFSFGVILYELLSNRRLFLAQQAEAILARVLMMDLQPFLEPLVEVDPELAKVVSDCLERDRTERVSSARELHQRLAALREADPSELTLPEFVRYLQQGPRLGLVRQDPRNDFAWSVLDLTVVDATTSMDDDEESVSLRRPLEAAAADLEAFGEVFFGPIRHADPDGAELELSQRDEVPSLEFLSAEPATGRDTQANTVEGASRLAEPVEGVTPAPQHAPAAATPASDAATRTWERVPAATEPTGGGKTGLVVGALLLVAVVLGGLLAFLLWPRGMDPAEATVAYLAAVEEGDAARAAEAIAALPEGAAADPAGQTLLALDAALAGDSAAAREHLGDVAGYPQPTRARAQLVLASVHRQEPGATGYGEAISAYTGALDCTGEGCRDLIEAARVGLRTSCAAVEGTPPAGCARVELPAWGGAGERALVRSVVLLDDGHLDEARAALGQGLDQAQGGTGCGCAGAAALRVWAGHPDALPAGSPLAARLAERGERESRGNGDCRLYGSLAGN